jgi:hypothetical protein
MDSIVYTLRGWTFIECLGYLYVLPTAAGFLIEDTVAGS